MKLILKLISILPFLSLSNAVFFLNLYPRIKLDEKPVSNAGEPLILTPYLDGNVALAQNLSRVPITDKIGFQSYAGFFTVNEKYNSNLYFWYFPPFSDNENAPVLLWLQGGPGGSSLYGLFTELGPLIVKKDGFALRKYHWALNNHLIFIDNPVGTGFSFTKSDKGYCSDEICVGKGLYSAMQQFYKLFPQLRTNDFYITGESYAGKYIPYLAMKIHEENTKPNTLTEELINLKGMAIGNGYCDPINQIDYGSYLYQHGMLDDNQLNVFKKYQRQVTIEIQNCNWVSADLLLDQLMDGSLTNLSFYKLYTGYDNYYNLLEPTLEDDMTDFESLLSIDNVRRSIHVGGLPFNDGNIVARHLAQDMLKSAASVISLLLSHYRILFYNGQLDVVVAYPLTVNFLRNLEFSSSSVYKTAPRHIWKVGKEIAGYVKTAGNLTEVLVRNAGHMVPRDQPEWAYDMICRFINSNL